MPSGGSVPSCEIEREREISLGEEAQTDWTVDMDLLGLQSDRSDFHVSDPGERAKEVWRVGGSSQLKGLCSFPWSSGFGNLGAAPLVLASQARRTGRDGSWRCITCRPRVWEIF
jgi:hypothetical protein